MDESTAETIRRGKALALKLLARREHSESELRQKLRSKLDSENVSDSLIENILGELIEAGYQSDRRFAELYAEQRKNRGYGPLAIRAKLGERGIDGDLSRSAIEKLAIDWSEHASDTLRRRFSDSELTESDQKVKAKLARFLQSRGFSASDSHRAMKCVQECVTD